MNDHLPNFLIVGAQKSGTTSLYRYLQTHPEVCMSRYKEPAFFYVDDLYRRGLDWYVETYFSGCGPGICGEASPQYMMSQAAARRIANDLPGVKIIMLLRNPIQRAYSHYLMSRRRRRESRTFDEVIYDAEQSTSLAQEQDPDFGYVSNGFYGTILSWYKPLLESGRLLVLYTEDLLSHRRAVLRSTFEFIGVDPNWLPGNLNQDFNRTGSRRWRRLDRWVRKGSPAKSLLRRVFGEERYARLWFWYETEFSVRKKDPGNMHADARMRLHRLLEEDMRTLAISGVPSAPWTEFAD